jgi:hypothetical protein
MREFHHIVDIDGLLPEEAARMRLVHDLLVEAGPPADLPAALERSTVPTEAQVIDFPLMPPRRWGAEGIGTLTEVLVSRPTENEIRPEYVAEWRYYYSSAAGNADLGRLQAQFDEYYAVLADNGVRVSYIEPPVPAIGACGWIKNPRHARPRRRP